MPRDDIDYCLEVRNSCLQVHPRLMSLIPGSDIDPGLTVVNYSAEIESEVDAIYKHMYDEQTSIDEVITLLQRSKVSSDTRDHEIFSCMLHFLFDEYKFFQSYYPARELAMTGYLFGSIIHHDLVDSVPLGIAIRYVVDALNCPPDTNLFKFGLQALSRFETRLAEWQPLCQALLRIPHLMEVRPDLAAIIHRAIAVGGDGSRSNADMRGISAGLTADPAPVFTSIHPDKFDAEIVEPPEELSDKILFIVNNLAPSNFDAKLSEMKEQFDDAFSRWFANYLVDQRISSEPNNHQLYLRFLDALDKRVLSKYILQETFAKAATVLNSEKTMQITSERLVLKNIASWLGTITLARDKPIRHKNLAFKDLLMEGFDHGRLIVVIPFVCKTLEPCSKSKVFKPPNPWLMAVITLLAEFYHYGEIKLNLKFEIEMLCKGLDIDLDTIEIMNVVRHRATAGDTGPAIPEYVTDIDSMPMNGFDPSHMQGEAQVMPIGPTPTAEPQRAVGAHIESILSSLGTSVVVSAQLAPYNGNHSFKRAVQVAVDHAVREVSDSMLISAP